MKTDTRLVVFLILLVSLVAVPPAAGCLGPPSIDLWDLVEEADSIVVVNVKSLQPSAFNRFLRSLNAAGETALESIEDVSPDGAFLLEELLDGMNFDLYRAYVGKLDVIETLHGSTPRGKLNLRFETWGALAIPGERAIVFLRDGLLWPYFLDYGNSALYSRGHAEFQDLRTAILAAVDLQNRNDSASRMDWAIATADLPGARRHVLPWLQRQSLSDDQKRSLADSFVRFPSLDGLFELLPILKLFPHPELDRRAASLLTAALSETDDPDYPATRLIEPMIIRLTNGDAMEALDACTSDLDLLLYWEAILEKLDFPAPEAADFAEVQGYREMKERLLDKMQAAFQQP